MSGQRKALIVAVDEYDQEALRNLRAPAADAEALGRVLGDRQIGDFTVEVVRNEPAHVIQAHVEELFSESRSDDVLLVHFSGHGLKSESGELFFAASNTRPNRLGSTAVSADFVQRCMRASRSRSVVLLLDCCYGGAFAQGSTVRAAGDVNVLDSFPHERTGGGRGRAVITASNAMEYAFEGDQLADDHSRRPSVFTSALVEGLATGDADRDEDGWVSLNDLYDYVFDKVREQSPHQTPSRHVELEGELYVARSRRRRIRPAPIPPDLQAAMTDPNMYTRLGAVHELQSRLTSDNLPNAVGAHEALADLARTDIRYVADPAAAALSQATLHPEETELHFGQITQGSAPPHRMLRLLGPPIARACTPRASDGWIRVNETAEGFHVSVDTANTGVLRGTLDLKGPTGEAAVAINVELLPAPLTPVQSSNETSDRQAVAAGVTGQPEERSAAQAHHEAELAAAEQRQQVEQLQQQIREHGAKQDWDAVLAVSDQLAALDPAAADPDGLASTAREQIARRKRAAAPTTTPREPVPTLIAPPAPASRPDATGSTHLASAPKLGPGKTILSVLWALLPLLSTMLSLGFLAPVLVPIPFAHAAARLGNRGLRWITAAYGLALLTLVILRGVAAVNNWSAAALTFAVILFVLGLFATIHAFVLRPRVFAPRSLPIASASQVTAQNQGTAKGLLGDSNS